MSLMMNYHVCVLHSESMRFNLYESHKLLPDLAFKPNRLYSPDTVCRRQKGQSMEMATLLCSMLIGFGYDAYVVSGYAIQDITENLMVRIEAPYPEEEEEEVKQDEAVDDEKYEVTPPRDLRSKFLLMLEDRARLRKIAEEEEKNMEIMQRRQEEEKAPRDKYEGQRVHGWVLIKKSKEVTEDVFVEPSNGFIYPPNSNVYLGVESIWNHRNYYVNMQPWPKEENECLEFNLQDFSKWEHLLVGEPQHTRKYEQKLLDDEEENRDMYDEQHLDMPARSWSQPIRISHEAFSMRYPGGAKITYYKRTIVEQYAPYVMQDGLVTKISRYANFTCTDLNKVEEIYENRSDKLYKSIMDVKTKLVTEYFNTGREDGVIKHVYHHHRDSFDDYRVINCVNRYDGLIKIETSRHYLTEHYSNREDLLYFRHADFGKMEGNRREITKIIQKFERNYNIPYQEDIAVQEFDLANRNILIKYHYGPDAITASYRDFQKPPPAEIGEVSMFHPELTVGYSSDFNAKQPKHLILYNLLEEQMKTEEKLLDDIRVMEKEVLKAFVQLRARELGTPSLAVSLFNVEQNVEHRNAMLQKEAEKQLKREKEVEDHPEYLGPYLAMLGNPSVLTAAQISQIRWECLNDLKKLLLTRAHRIQASFESASDALAAKQHWFTVHYDLLTPAAITSTMEDIQNRIRGLKLYEMRLIRHRDLSGPRYEALQNYLANHKSQHEHLYSSHVLRG